MDSILLAKSVLNILVPYLPELLSPGSLSWFETTGKENNARNLAETTWKNINPLISSHPKLKYLLEKLAAYPHDINTYNEVVNLLAKGLDQNRQVHASLSSWAMQGSSGSVHISGNLANSTVVTGHGNTITTNYTVSVGNVQKMIINQGGVNRSAEIRDVWIDLSLQGGKYPTFCWFDPSGVYSTLKEKTWWEPKEYSYDRLMEILMQEINKWSRDGWDIVENNLDDLWKYDYGYKETFLTWAIGVAIPAAGTVLKRWRRYRGALFHVRRFI